MVIMVARPSEVGCDFCCDASQVPLSFFPLEKPGGLFDPPDDSRSTFMAAGW